LICIYQGEREKPYQSRIATASAQTFPNAGGQKAQRHEGTLFNAILIHQMRDPGTDGTTGKDRNNDPGQGLGGNATLMDLAPAFVAQQLRPTPNLCYLYKRTWLRS